ncbi:MAG: hypothetical protein U0573_12355 [Phycisphaerales bacterium]|nr:hypothetical protein [Planctomycetota bacterium]
MRGLIAVMAVAGLMPALTARAEFIVQDSLQKDQGWSSFDSKVSFSEAGLTAFGVIARELEWLPSEFDARITIDASKAIVWGFGVAGSYSPETGFSGFAMVADQQEKPGITFGRWENDKIVDSIWIDAEARKMFDGLHEITIGVRDSVVFAGIDGAVVGKLGFDAKPAGTQVVLASFSDGDTHFRDLSIIARIPSQGGAMAAVPLLILTASKRRRPKAAA